MEKQIVVTRHICRQCGHIGLPFYETKGNRLSEVLLWLFFIIPGIFYTMWRSSSRYPVCPKCLTPHMIPGDTTKGKRMIEERGVEPTFEYKEKKKRRWTIWIFLIILLVLLAIILCYFSCGAEFKRIKDLIIPIYSSLSANSFTSFRHSKTPFADIAGIALKAIPYRQKVLECIKNEGCDDFLNNSTLLVNICAIIPNLVIRAV